MNNALERKTKAKKTYTKKDGTVVTREYTQTYWVKDHTEKTLRKKIVTDVKNATLEQLKYIDTYLNGRGEDRDADGGAPAAVGGEGGNAEPAKN